MSNGSTVRLPVEGFVGWPSPATLAALDSVALQHGIGVTGAYALRHLRTGAAYL